MNDLPDKKALESRGESHGFRLNGRQFGGLVLLIVLVVFILQNRDPMKVSFLMVSFDSTQWIVLSVTALVGAACGALGMSRRRRRRNRRAD